MSSDIPLLKEEGCLRPSIVRKGADGVVSRGPYLTTPSAAVLRLDAAFFLRLRPIGLALCALLAHAGGAAAARLEVPLRVSLDTLREAFNAQLTGYRDGPCRYLHLKPATLESRDGRLLLSLPGNGGLIPEARLSDHSPFWDQGYPALMITDTAFLRNPHYHGATDTLETLNLEFMAKVCEGVIRGVLEL